MIIREAIDLPTLNELIMETETIAFDVESSGLNPRRDTLIGFSIASENFSAYIILKEYIAGTLHEVLSYDDVRQTISALMGKKLIGHNFSFDSRFVYCQMGIDLFSSLHADTMLLSHTCDENRFNYGLKQLGTEIFGRDAASEQADLQESMKAAGAVGKGELYKADSTIIAKYGRKDAELTYALYKHFKPLAEADKVWDFYCTEVIPLLKHVSIPMELFGLPVDVSYLQQSQTEITKDLEALESNIQCQIAPLLEAFNNWYLNKEFPFKLTGPFAQMFAKLESIDLPITKGGQYSLTAKNIAALHDCLFKSVMLGHTRLPPDKILQVQQALLTESGTKYAFNILSKDHLKRLFFGTPNTPSLLNEKPLSTTELGNPQVDDDFLDAMASKYDWVKQLRIYNKLTKLKGTYIDRILENQENGIYYPQFFQHRTVSGRYGSDLQQMPRKLTDGESLVLKYTNKVRDFFISGPDKLLIGADYESLEPKCFSHASGDPRLINIFNIGHDFYSTIAIDTEHLKEYSADKSAPNYLGKLNKQKRQSSKAYALGVCYGMTGYKLKFELNISESEANQLVKNYLNAYPGLASFMEKSRQFALKNGYVITELGRKRRFPELKAMYAQYGEDILHPLRVWERWHDTPAVYERMKEVRKRCQNYLNNAINVKIQGLAASIVNRAAIATTLAYKAANLDARIVMNIHDELVVIADKAIAEQAAKILQHCMQNTVKLSLPLTAEPCIATKYGDTK